jgi:hypothetical protein
MKPVKNTSFPVLKDFSGANVNWKTTVLNVAIIKGF